MEFFLFIEKLLLKTIIRILRKMRGFSVEKIDADGRKN